MILFMGVSFVEVELRLFRASLAAATLLMQCNSKARKAKTASVGGSFWDGSATEMAARLVFQRL
jgi:hypothetical protein